MKSPHVRTRKIVENSPLSGQGTGLNAHRLVAETAVKMADEYFDLYMAKDNALWKLFKETLTPKQRRVAFVARVAPALLEPARLILTDMLTQPDDVVSQKLKDEIAEALILDTDFRANRTVAAQHSTLPGMMH